MTYYSRKSARIPGYNYSTCNYYFVTICTHNRRCIFGKPNNLNNLGKTAQKHIEQIPEYYHAVKIDKYVVMPNHVHMIIILEDNSHDLNQIIAQYKSGVTREIHRQSGEIAVWQRSYHDHVIRDQISYENIWNYIAGNPMNWDKDCFFVDSAYGSRV